MLSWPFRQKPTGLSQRNFWLWTSSDGVNPVLFTGVSELFLLYYYICENTASLDRKGQKHCKMRMTCEPLLLPPLLLAGNRLRKLHSCKQDYLSWKRKDDSRGRTKTPEGRAKSHGELFPVRRKTKSSSKNYQHLSGCIADFPWTSESFVPPIAPQFWTEVSRVAIRCFVPSLYVKCVYSWGLYI